MKKYIHVLKLLIALVLIVGMIVFISKNQNIYQKISEVSLISFFSLLIMHLLNYILLSKTHINMMSVLGRKIKMVEAFQLSNMAEFFNYVLPAKGGTLVRFSHLKNKYEIDFKSLLHITTLKVFMGLTVFGLLGVVLLSLYPESMDLRLFKMSITLLSMFIILFPALLIKKINRDIVKFHFKAFISSLLCYIAIFTIYIAKIYFQYNLLGVELEFISLIQLSMMLLLLSLFPILPGNLGVRELVMGVLATRYGIEASNAILIGLLDRVILSLLIFPVGLYSYLKYFTDIKNFLKHYINLNKLQTWHSEVAVD